MRFKIFRILITASFSLIALALFYMQAVKGQYYYDLSTNNRVRVVPLEGWRGQIGDRNNIVLAENRISYKVIVTPQFVEDLDVLFNFLAQVLHKEVKSLQRVYQRKKVAPFTPIVLAEDITKEQAFEIEENKFRFPALIVQEGYSRSYPLGANSAHILGYVGKINRNKIERMKEYGYSSQSIVGYSGVEEYYDNFLRGEEGGIQVEVNSRGQQVKMLGFKEPKQGQNITLTIDSRIQQMALDLFGSQTGAFVMMDMHNGEILALVSSPAYDPNVFVNGMDQEDTTYLFSNSAAPMLNRAIKGMYPPGSVFKIPVAVCAIANDKVSRNTSFQCRGSLELGSNSFRCTHIHGTQNLIEAIAHSCNVYFYQVGKIVGPEKIAQFARMFGLGHPTNIDLPYEEDGRVPNPGSVRRKWYGGDTFNFSIGQGSLLTTPLQLTQMMATIGNDGMEVQPHLIKEIGGVPVDRYAYQRQILDPSIYKEVQRGMRATITDYSGTAHDLDIEGLYVAGKTGTAQSAPNKDHHAWFVGYVKTEKAKYAFCVFLEYGGSSHNAVVIARDILWGMKDKGML